MYYYFRPAIYVDFTHPPIQYEQNRFYISGEIKEDISKMEDGDVLLLFEEIIPNHNRWGDSAEEFAILANKHGIGLYHSVPNGYSSYTYDPDVEEKFYLIHDLEMFCRMGLTQDQKDILMRKTMFSESGFSVVQEKLKELWND